MKLSLPKFILAAPLCLSLSAGSVLAQAENATLEKRAEAYGALAHLPKSTEGAYSIRNLNGIFDAITESNFFNRILELSGAAGDGANDAIAQARQGLSTYAGEEITIAYAGGTAVEMKRLMTLYDMYVRLTYGSLGLGISSGNFDGDVDPEMLMAEVKRSLGKADSPLSKALQEIQMPPIIIGSKMGEAATGVMAQMNELEGELPPFITVQSFEVAGTEMKSWSINFKDVFDENAQAEMEDAIGDKAVSDRIAKAIRGKRVELSYGAVGDYFVVALGRDHAHLDFVEDPSESIVSHPSFKKLDPYLGKPIHGIAFSKKNLLEADTSDKLVETMADAFVDGLTSEGSPLMKKMGTKLKRWVSS